MRTPNWTFEQFNKRKRKKMSSVCARARELFPQSHYKSVFSALPRIIVGNIFAGTHDAGHTSWLGTPEVAWWLADRYHYHLFPLFGMEGLDILRKGSVTAIPHAVTVCGLISLTESVQNQRMASLRDDQGIYESGCVDSCSRIDRWSFYLM